MRILIVKHQKVAGFALELRLEQEPDMDVVAQLDSGETVWHFFDRGGLILPDYVCAGDMMRREFITVRSGDTCAKAIDLFVKNQVADLPVIDDDGKLRAIQELEEAQKQIEELESRELDSRQEIVPVLLSS